MEVRINEIAFIKKVDKAVKEGAKQREIVAALEAKGQNAAVEMSNKLQYEFQKHPVTKELSGDAGAHTSLPLPAGPSGGRYGNLLAFFGLTEDKVLIELQNMQALFQSPIVRVIAKRGTGQYQLSIIFPKIEAFYGITPPPGGAYGVSWLKGLEQGLIQNFSRFLFRERGIGSSRTGTGAQVEHALRKGAQTVPPIPYVTQIYSKVLGDKTSVNSIVGSFVKRNFKI